MSAIFWAFARYINVQGLPWIPQAHQCHYATVAGIPASTSRPFATVLLCQWQRAYLKEKQKYLWNCLDIFGTREIQPKNGRLKNKMISKIPRGKSPRSSWRPRNHHREAGPNNEKSPWKRQKDGAMRSRVHIKGVVNVFLEQMNMNIRSKSQCAQWTLWVYLLFVT